MNNEEDVEDNITIIEKNNNKYFTEIENSVPHFQQELFELQNEFYKTWKNMINKNIAIQKEFADKTGMNHTMPKTAQTIIKNMNQEFANFRSMRDRVIITVIQNAKKNIKMWNNNAEIFSDWNKSIIQYWASVLAAKPKK